MALSTAAVLEATRDRRELAGYCNKILGSASDADDAVQETMVRAWTRRDSFEGRSSVHSWLYRIATNVCLDMLRRRNRRAVPIRPQWPGGPAPRSGPPGRGRPGRHRDRPGRHRARPRGRPPGPPGPPASGADPAGGAALVCPEVADLLARPWPPSTAPCSGPEPRSPPALRTRSDAPSPRRRPTGAPRRLRLRLRAVTTSARWWAWSRRTSSRPDLVEVVEGVLHLDTADVGEAGSGTAGRRSLGSWSPTVPSPAPPWASDVVMQDTGRRNRGTWRRGGRRSPRGAPSS